MPTAPLTRSPSLPCPAPTLAPAQTQRRLAAQPPRLRGAMVACWVLAGISGLGLSAPAAQAADSSAVTVDSSVLDGLGPTLTIPDLMLPPSARPVAPMAMGGTATGAPLPSQGLLPDPASPPKSRMMVPMPGATPQRAAAPTLAPPQARYTPPPAAPAPVPYSAPPALAPAAPKPAPAPAPAPSQTASMPATAPTPAPAPTPAAAPAPTPSAVAVDTKAPQPAPQPAPQTAAPPTTAPAAPPAATPAPAPTQQTASLPPPTVQASGLSLAFGENDTTVPPGANSALDQVVSRLNSNPGLRVRIEAYASGGSAGKSRARRLSLSRALAVRSYLLDQGINTERVDVRALGTPDSGNADRVDIGWVSG